MATAEKTTKQAPAQTFKEETVIVLTLPEREAQLLQIIHAKIGDAGPARNDMNGIAMALGAALGYSWYTGAEKYAHGNGHTASPDGEQNSWIDLTFDRRSSLKAK